MLDVTREIEEMRIVREKIGGCECERTWMLRMQETRLDGGLELVL